METQIEKNMPDFVYIIEDK